MSVATATTPSKASPTMPEIECYAEKKKIEVGEYANLRKALLLHGISLYEGPNKIFNCRGMGVCGSCGVEILEGMKNLTPRTTTEKWHLRKHSPTFRLSCRCHVLKGKVVVITHPKIK